MMKPAAVADAAPQDVVAQERRRRMQDEIGQSRAAAVLEHLLGRQASCSDPSFRGGARCRGRRSAADRDRARRPGRRRDRFVHAPELPARAAPIVEAELIVRIPVGRADPAAEVPRHARDAKAGDAGGFASDRADFGGELARDALVGVDRQDPVVAGLARGEVLLRGVAGPVADDDPRPVRPRQLRRRRPCCRSRRRASRRPRRPIAGRPRCWPLRCA